MHVQQICTVRAPPGHHVGAVQVDLDHVAGRMVQAGSRASVQRLYKLDGPREAELFLAPRHIGRHVPPACPTLWPLWEVPRGQRPWDWALVRVRALFSKL